MSFTLREILEMDGVGLQPSKLPPTKEALRMRKVRAKWTKKQREAMKKYQAAYRKRRKK